LAYILLVLVCQLFKYWIEFFLYSLLLIKYGNILFILHLLLLVLYHYLYHLFQWI
jgi:hypothetical protein